MRKLRNALQQLGWPETLSDGQIADELLRRWVECTQPPPLALSDPMVVARGVYSALAHEGRLDALAWTSAPDVGKPLLNEPVVDPIFRAQQVKHDEADADYLKANRRRSQRWPRRELVDLMLDYGSRRAQAWLVDVSADGVAMLMESDNVPTVGQHTEAVIHNRDGVPEALGTGCVVRTEMLCNDIGLVCVELDESISRAAEDV